MLLLVNSVDGRDLKLKLLRGPNQGQIRTYKVTREPHYDVDAKMAVSEFY